MNQKAIKKQLTTISSKDEAWQGFLGATVPNRIDDTLKGDQAEAKKEEPVSKKAKDKKDKEDKGGLAEAAEKTKPSKNDAGLKPNAREV